MGTCPAGQRAGQLTGRGGLDVGDAPAGVGAVLGIGRIAEEHRQQQTAGRRQLLFGNAAEQGVQQRGNKVDDGQSSHPEHQQALGADAAVEVEEIAAVIPPFGAAGGQFHHPRCHVFQKSAEHHGGSEFQRRAGPQPVEKREDQHRAAAVDGQPGPVEKAPVHQLAGGHQVHPHFPQPAQHRQAEKDAQQRPHRVAAHIVQRRGRTPLFLGDGIQPYGIGQTLGVVHQAAHPHLLGQILLKSPVLLAAQQQNAQIVGQKTPPARQPPVVMFGAFHHLEHIPVALADAAGGGLFVEIPVPQPLGFGQPAADGLGPQLGVVVGEKGDFVGVGIDQARQPQSETREKIPSHKGQLHHKALPFVPLHHPAGEGDGLAGGEGGVFRHDIGHQIIGIPLDHHAHPGEGPEGIKYIFYQHDPGRPQPAAHPQQKGKPLGGHPVIDQPLQKHPPHRHRKQILHQHPEGGHAQSGQQNQRRQPRAFRAGDRGRRRDQRHQQ